MMSLSTGKCCSDSLLATVFSFLYHLVFPHSFLSCFYLIKLSKVQGNAILWTVAVYTCAKYYSLQGTQQLEFFSHIPNFQKFSHMLELYLSILRSGMAFFPLVFIPLNKMLNFHNSIYLYNSVVCTRKKV